ncbi:MAG: helicase [Gammaproteobacteria bacterium]|nr:helicase [Gammaproteobacteria bacterium]
MLRDHQWKLKYTTHGEDLVSSFYIPALEDAERYDRLTGYFNAGALTLAARGIEGLVRNGGHMRLVVGCTLGEPEVEAIERGEELRSQVERHLMDFPLVVEDAEMGYALELLSWMVAHDHLDVKVAVPCDSQGNPVPDGGLFHEKSGVIEDRAGYKIAWTGSLNETAGGWRRNWETINVSTSWTDPDRVALEESNFEEVWAGPRGRWIVLDVPDAVQRNLLQFLPEDGGLPKRLRHAKRKPQGRTSSAESAPKESESPEDAERRSKVWDFIRKAPTLPIGGSLVGEATSAVTPWPHQVRAFERMYGNWPPRLLIADEVGLGKTIQAGMLIRQAWIARRAKRVLILAPKAVLGQWQMELREKFNLNWPIYDQGRLTWYPSQAMAGRHQRPVQPNAWHRESAVIVSSQLMRRQERTTELLAAEPWDLVVLDEAHHARRRGAAGSAQEEDRPNALLALMRELRHRAKGLLLLTATPMQVDPIEVWDLLNLLEMPDEWSARGFTGFFSAITNPDPSATAMENMAALFRAAEAAYGPLAEARAQRLSGLSRLGTAKVLRALRDRSGIPRRRLNAGERTAALAMMRSHTPISHQVSRHTRDLLRSYFEAGMLKTPIAAREVQDRFIEMPAAERAVYEAVEEYIASTYNQADESVRNAVGFIMTVYRRRLASSFAALRATLRKRLEAVERGAEALTETDEDVPDDEVGDEALDAEEVTDLSRKALLAEEQASIAELLASVEKLAPDTKLDNLFETLDELREGGHEQVMVFTQYADTMDFLRGQLLARGGRSLMCYSGRGGEVPLSGESDAWQTITRDEAKRRFRDGEAEVLLCTDAAAEGLNFQFCGALVNYDMPWNPMRVEQRIGRIDRLGQKHSRIRIVNLQYDDTVETDVYRALQDRIQLFQSVVGKLQPILARLSGAIGNAVLRGTEQSLPDSVLGELDEAESQGFDLDAMLEDDVSMPDRPEPPLTMAYLEQVIKDGLVPPDTAMRRIQKSEFGLHNAPLPEEVRVTTDPDYYSEHSDSVEFWSPGGVVFPDR